MTDIVAANAVIFDEGKKALVLVGVRIYIRLLLLAQKQIIKRTLLGVRS